jgi:hypothetical protein
MKDQLQMLIADYVEQLKHLQQRIKGDWNCLASQPENVSDALDENSDIFDDLTGLIADLKRVSIIRDEREKFLKQLRVLLSIEAFDN